MDTDTRAAAAIAQQIADGDKSPAAIIVAIRGCGPHVWHILDSRPGAIHTPRLEQWHPWLRRVRNSTDIFAAINHK